MIVAALCLSSSLFGQTSPAPDVASVHAALAAVPASLEHGRKSETLALIRSAENNRAVWENSTNADAIRVEIRFRHAQLLARDCAGTPARAAFDSMADSITNHCPKLLPDRDDELGMLAAWEGSFATAANLHSNVVSMRRANDDSQGLGRSLNLLGAAELSLGNITAATRCFDEATDVYSRTQDERGKMITRMNRALVLRTVGQLAGAHAELLTVVQFARANQQPDVEMQALANLASVLQTIGSYHEALTSAEAALRLNEQLQDCRASARLRNLVGVLCRDTGDYSRADRELNAALQLARANGDRVAELAARNNLGWLAVALKQPEKAREILTGVVEERRAIGDRAGEADAQANLGSALYGMRQVTAARSAFEEALKLRREIQDVPGVISTLINLGACEAAGRRAVPAVRLFEEARDAASETGAIALEASAWNNLGLIHKSGGQLDRAADSYAQARWLRAQTGDPVAEAVTLNNLMALAQAQQLPRLGAFYGKLAVERFQNIRSNLLWLNVEAQQSFTAFCQPAYRRLADLLIQLGRLPEAERVLVMLKEEEFSGFIRRDAGQVGPAAPMPKTSTEAGLMDRDASLAAQAAAVGVRWRELHEKGAARRTADENAEFRQLKERRENLAQNYNRFLAELRSELGTQREDKVREIAEAEALQSLLLEMRRSGAGEAAVLYTLVAETNYRVIVITADSTLDFKTPIAATNLNLKVAQFRNVLSDDRRLPDPLPAAQELYRIIFCNGDVDAALKAAKVETVMWSLDGTLRYLPMAALHDGKGYIAERYRNVVITPASIARLERKPQPSWAGLGLGVSKAHEVKLEHRPGNVERIKFSPLSEVPVELRGIIRDETVGSAGAVSGRIMLDGQFTEATLRDALEERYQLVHIASHFYFRPGDETSSFLLLGDGNPLNVSQLKNFRNLFESVNLLTLSACETAVGGADENDGANGAEVDSFGELAQRKGAAAIVATLWPVNDESTSLLMREFYRLRQTNPAWTKAEALRQAQLKLLRGNVKPTQSSTRRAAILADDPGAKPSPDFTHPYFWAPFVLTGNWQ